MAASHVLAAIAALEGLFVFGLDTDPGPGLVSKTMGNLFSYVHANGGHRTALKLLDQIEKDMPEIASIMPDETPQ